MVRLRSRVRDSPPALKKYAPVGQWFKPSHSHCGDRGFESHLEYYMVTIAQLAERRIVVPNVVGSSPTGHPKRLLIWTRISKIDS